MTYKVNIVETLSGVIEVTAETKEEAVNIVKELHTAEHIILSADDCVDVDIAVLED